MHFLYNLFIRLYSFGISIAALWNKKAAQWKSGRKNLWTELEQTFSKPHAVVWIHASSAGEFEQAKPVIEALKREYPQYKILVTFFSPSGYPAGKKFALADYVFYLPLDTAQNAKRFVTIVQPKLVVFVKYDFWYHHLKAVHERNIPLLLISAIFRKNQTFFKPYGRFYLNMLHLFTHLFVQDETSYGLLKKFGIHHCTIAGDTRFDRVLQITADNQQFLELDATIGGKFQDSEEVIVAGSTWPDDEKMLHGLLKKLTNVKLIIAPHEINEANIQSIQHLFTNAFRFSDVDKAFAVEWVVSNNEAFWTNKTDAETAAWLKKFNEANVIIIDNVGLLSRLYKYATIAYIGGGFNKSGIHNTLEAAVFGKPVIFGPNYQKFREARELIACGGAFSYANAEELESHIHKLLTDETALKQNCNAAADYVRNNGGATEKIMHYIQENRLLTN